jgi:hypothetical protein
MESRLQPETTAVKTMKMESRLPWPAWRSQDGQPETTAAKTG